MTHDHTATCKLCPLLQAKVAKLEEELKAARKWRTQYMREYRQGKRRTSPSSRADG